MKFSPDGEFFATAGKVNFENTVVKLCICATLYFKTMCTPALVCTRVCGTCSVMCTQSKRSVVSFLISVHLIIYWTWISVWANLTGQNPPWSSVPSLYRQALWHRTFFIRVLEAQTQILLLMGHTLAIELSPASSTLFLNLQTLTDFFFLVLHPYLIFGLREKKPLISSKVYKVMWSLDLFVLFRMTVF